MFAAVVIDERVAFIVLTIFSCISLLRNSQANFFSRIIVNECFHYINDQDTLLLTHQYNTCAQSHLVISSVWLCFLLLLF